MSNDKTDALDKAVDQILVHGESQAIDGMSKSSAPLRTIYDIAQQERKRKARALGRRPLFTPVDLSRVH